MPSQSYQNKTKKQASAVIKVMNIRSVQQQLPKSSRLSGVWGDPDVHDLTPMRTRHIERPVPTDPQEYQISKSNKLCLIQF